MVPPGVLHLDNVVDLSFWVPTSLLFELISPSFLVHASVLLRGLEFVFFFNLFVFNSDLKLFPIGRAV